MRNVLNRGAVVLLVLVTAIAVGVFVGCSSDDTDKAETATAETQETMAEATEAAVDFAAYANPKEGVCPACGMKVNAEHIKVAKIDDKEYACCSAGCVAMIIEDPAKYLAADAAETTGHEGHNH